MASQHTKGQSAPTDGNTFNIRDFGAKGDGKTKETSAINAAIERCAAKGGGQVLFPPGHYLSGTIQLRSHVTLFLTAGAVLRGTTNLSHYEKPAIPSFMPEAKWGKWHRALIVGENIEHAAIAGQGTIDGNKVFDATGEEKMRGPHTISLVNSKGFSLRDISIVDSANYAVFFQLTDDVAIRNLKITGGWDGIHFRGGPGRPCRNVSITGCEFYTGDDSIAGRYWDNVLISDCILNSSCNGIRLIGPAVHLIVHGCLFYGEGRQPHRSSKRTNMLSGIILQPGAWDKTEGLLDDVLLANNTMHKVASPVTIWTKGDNPVNRITVSALKATGVYRSALSVESWGEAPIAHVAIKDATIEFTGGGKVDTGRQAVKNPSVDARNLPAWGVYARNVKRLSLQDVRMSFVEKDLRPAIIAEDVADLEMDDVRYPRIPEVPEPIITRGK